MPVAAVGCAIKAMARRRSWLAAWLAVGLSCALASGGRVRPPARAPRATQSSALVPIQPPLIAPELWRSELVTDDGLRLNEPDLREKRSNWLRDLLSIGQSRVLERVAPQLFGTSLWAAFVSVAYEFDRVAEGSSHLLSDAVQIPSWPHEAVGSFLAILLVFRTDQAYQRFWEGRELWASVHSSARQIAMLSLCHFPPGRERDVLLAHASAFPIALKQHLRGVRGDTRELEAVWRAYTDPHLAELSDASDACAVTIETLRQTDNIPSTLVASLTAELSTLLRREQPEGYAVYAQDSSGQRQAALWAQIQAHVERLTDVIGSCERLKLTPIPLSVSRHTSRFFTLYLLTLPLALLHECSAVLVPAVSIGMGYVVYAMEEIGHIIEEPFSIAFGDPLAAEGDDGSVQASISRAGATTVVRVVSYFYEMLAMVVGYNETSWRALSRERSALEVLPLRKYCGRISLEIANLAATHAQREAIASAARAPREPGAGESPGGVASRAASALRRGSRLLSRGGGQAHAGADADAAAAACTADAPAGALRGAAHAQAAGEAAAAKVTAARVAAAEAMAAAANDPSVLRYRKIASREVEQLRALEADADGPGQYKRGLF